MTYAVHRVFCSTPGDLEPERQAFHDAVGEVNEDVGVTRNVLFAPVSIVPLMVNKLFYQPAVDANVRECKFFVQVLQHTWGPREKNFECDYNLAWRLKSDPGSAMEGVALFFKAADGFEVEPEILQLKSSTQSRPGCAVYEFASLDEYKRQLRDQLTAWLRTVH
jgi:hypothetical protein